MRITTKLIIGLISSISAISCSKESGIGNLPSNHQEKYRGSILIQESHTEEVGSLQINAHFPDLQGELQRFGGLYINGQQVPATGSTFSGADFSSSFIGSRAAITLYDNEGEMVMQDSIMLTDALQAELPREISAGTEILWNTDDQEATVEITVRYSSNAPYNEEQGFEENDISRTARVSGRGNSYIVDKSLLKDIPEGAWLNLSIARTVSHQRVFRHEEEEFNYTCTWKSTDLHTVRFKE